MFVETLYFCFHSDRSVGPIGVHVTALEIELNSQNNLEVRDKLLCLELSTLKPSLSIKLTLVVV